MNVHPRVSVVIPAYRSEATLAEAVESVLAQTYGDLEVLIVEDGSDDGTLDVAEECRELDPRRVKILRHEGGANRGVSASRNLALDHATGEFIGFLDADDAWLPEKLAWQIDVFTRFGEIGFVFGDVYLSIQPDPHQPMARQQLSRAPHRAHLAQRFNGEELSAARVLNFDPRPFTWIVSPTPLVRSRYFADGLRFVGPPQLDLQYEDFLMWRILAMRTTFHAIAEPIAIYRVHDTSFTGTFHRSKSTLDHLRGLEQVERLLLRACHKEVHRLGWRRKLRRSLGPRIIDSIPRVAVNQLPAVGVLAWRHGRLGSYTFGVLLRGFRWLERMLRRTLAFRLVRPTLRRLKNAIYRPNGLN